MQTSLERDGASNTRVNHTIGVVQQTTSLLFPEAVQCHSKRPLHNSCDEKRHYSQCWSHDLAVAWILPCPALHRMPLPSLSSINEYAGRRTCTGRSCACMSLIAVTTQSFVYTPYWSVNSTGRQLGYYVSGGDKFGFALGSSVQDTWQAHNTLQVGSCVHRTSYS